VRQATKQATAAYRTWQSDAFPPSLLIKNVGDDLWSVRIGRAQRALGRFEGDRLVWIWIGSHAEYDHVIR